MTVPLRRAPSGTMAGMNTSDVLKDAFGRIPRLVHRATAGLNAHGLAFQPDTNANSIAWLIWHLTRIQDDHVSEIAGRNQVWFDGWADRLTLPFPPDDTGFGHSPEQVAAVRPETPDDLLGYHDAVAAQTMSYLDTVTDSGLDRIIDRSWDPPTTVGVRLVSVIGDCHQHVGQANYIRGIVDRGSR